MHGRTRPHPIITVHRCTVALAPPPPPPPSLSPSPSQLPVQEPYNNIIRTTVEAMAAVMGGTQVAHRAALLARTGASHAMPRMRAPQARPTRHRRAVEGAGSRYLGALLSSLRSAFLHVCAVRPSMSRSPESVCAGCVRLHCAVQSLHTNAFDEAIGLPTDFAAAMARNTQVGGAGPRARYA